jgi:hypothetical protein
MRMSRPTQWSRAPGRRIYPCIVSFVRMRKWIKYDTIHRLAAGLILLLLGEIIISWCVFAIVFYYKQWRRDAFNIHLQPTNSFFSGSSSGVLIMDCLPGTWQKLIADFRVGHAKADFTVAWEQIERANIIPSEMPRSFRINNFFESGSSRLWDFFVECYLGEGIRHSLCVETLGIYCLAGPLLKSC